MGKRLASPSDQCCRTRSVPRRSTRPLILTMLLGVTDTPLSRGGTSASGSKEDVEKLAAALSGRIPLGRMAFPSDIADAVIYMLSDAASFITGQVLPVNGGSD